MDLWTVFRRLGTFYRSDYDEPVDEPEDSKDASQLPLDEVLVAGTANLTQLGLIAEEFAFATDAFRILKDEAYAKRRVWNNPTDLPPPSMAKKTASKWKAHITTMQSSLSSAGQKINPILTPVLVGLVILVCTYFAVPKNEELSRTIFNGRILSLYCRPPPPVNLVSIAGLLILVSGYRGLSFDFLDIRHWFHQLPVNPFLRRLFVIRSEDSFLSWQVLPMGWCWSPYLAQCMAWSLILHIPQARKRRCALE
jgi:hypothetical protein